MGRIPPKAVLCAFFCVWVAVFFSGCVEPIDLNAFVDDDEVQEIIEKGAGAVNVTQGSDASIRGGNKKISGLQTGKYYMVEEWDENGASKGVHFVSANGSLSKNLIDIGPVKSGEISDLTNHYHYRVRSARPLEGDVPFSILAPPVKGTAENGGGAITISGPEDDSFVVYNLSVPAFPDVVEIPVTPAGSASSARRSQNGAIIALIGSKTVNDYVFYEKIDNETINFFVLRVTSIPGLEIPSEEGDLNITVSFVLNTDEKTFTLDPDSVTFSKADAFDSVKEKKISITLLDDEGIFDEDSIKWTYNAGQEDEITWGGATLDIDFDDPYDPENKYVALLAVGEYTISIEAAVEGVPYSSSIILVIED